MRVLLITPPGSGQIIPFKALGTELAERGHEVTWSVSAAAVPRIRAAGFDAVAAGPADLDFENRESFSPGHAAPTGWAEFVYSGVRLVIDPSCAVAQDLLRAYSPETFAIVVGDIASPAARLVSEIWGVPWVCVCTTSLSLASSDIPFYAFEDEQEAGESVAVYLDGHRKIRQAFNAVRSALGLAPVRQGWNDLFSKRLTLVASASDIEYPRSDGQNLAYVGALAPRNAPNPLAADVETWLFRHESEGVVYATLGTAFNRHGTLMRTLIEGAVESKRAVIVSTGPGYTVPMDLMTALPERVKVVSWVDHAALLPRVAVVASHGGMGTCNDAIRHGLPMLNIPIGCDHPSASRKIERYGMALRLALAKATPATIGAKMGELVDDPSFGRRARTLRDAWNALGGAARAVDLIEETAADFGDRMFRVSSGNPRKLVADNRG